MARNTNTKAATNERDQLAAQITEQLLAAISAPKQRRTMTQWFADKVADAGDGVSEISAGVTVARENFAVGRESALMRQRQRTADKIARLVEQRLNDAGL